MTKLWIRKRDGRWHIIVTHDPEQGPVGSYTVGVGWSSFELVRKAFILYSDTQRRINAMTNNNLNNRRTW